MMPLHLQYMFHLHAGQQQVVKEQFTTPPLSFIVSNFVEWAEWRTSTEAEFLNVIGTKVTRAFLLVIHSNGSPPPRPVSKSGLKLVCNVRTLCTENLSLRAIQDYAQKPQRNCAFMNSASGVFMAHWPSCLDGPDGRAYQVICTYLP